MMKGLASPGWPGWKDEGCAAPRLNSVTAVGNACEGGREAGPRPPGGRADQAPTTLSRCGDRRQLSPHELPLGGVAGDRRTYRKLAASRLRPGDPAVGQAPLRSCLAAGHRKSCRSGDVLRTVPYTLTSPRRTRAHGSSPAFCSVRREATLETLQRAAGRLPIS